MKKRYMQMIYIDDNGDARQTGVGAIFKTDSETTKAFESVRPKDLGIESPEARFILDLCEGEGDIVDSLAISIKTFEFVSNEPFRGNQYYVDYDNAENERIRAEINESKYTA